jgi:hypothetical protein
MKLHRDPIPLNRAAYTLKIQSARTKRVTNYDKRRRIRTRRVSVSRRRPAKYCTLLFKIQLRLPSPELDSWFS